MRPRPRSICRCDHRRCAKSTPIRLLLLLSPCSRNRESKNIKRLILISSRLARARAFKNLPHRSRGGINWAMAYQTFRVEITRDETRDDGPVGIEITAYIDRMPETNEATIGRLSRAWRGVWNSRLQYTGDFDTLAEALAAITAAYPEADRIRCYEYSVDNEFPVEVAPLVRSGENWLPSV